MATGFLTAALCLLVAQGPGDVQHFNFRNFAFPVDVPPALQPEIKELLLYGSDNQGRTWGHVAGPITPDKKQFAYYAPGDGEFWLRVVQVKRNGTQDPDDLGIKQGRPDMKVVVDTLKPIIKSLQVQRSDDDVFVNWDVQEDHLDPTAMRLEYQIKDASIGGWKAVPVQGGLKGTARFTPGHRQALTVRLTVRDQAKNESFAEKEVAGAVTAAGFSAAGQSPLDVPIVPKDVIVPKGPTETVKPLIVPPPMGIDIPADKNLFTKPNPGPVAPLVSKDPIEKVVADSSMPPPQPPKVAVPPALGGIAPPPKDFDVKPIANPVATKKSLPAPQQVNQHQVMLEYQLKRVGPSGIGGIEVWLTKDDGDTWEPFAADEDVQSNNVNLPQKRKFDLRDASDRPFADGIYGLALVVKNRAGLGKKPRPGDAPEIRIEIDTQLPEAQLYMPVPDPQNPDQILLKWSARDKNLADRPIHLEYAARPDGEWLPIRLDLENNGRFTNERVTGDYSWKVPPNTPLQVYLRLRVRDKAGNERVLVTPQPQFVDLTEPEGALIGVQPSAKAP